MMKTAQNVISEYASHQKPMVDYLRNDAGNPAICVA